jgi:REP element-mobilizing transposase RayT
MTYFLSAIGDTYVTVSVKGRQAMPRKARIVIPGVAHHVVQRGHNRQVVFAADEDFQFYLENLTELKGELDVRLYAYCLMTNHVHLLLMPAQGQTLASLLKALAGRQTRYVNRVEGRSGTLWEGRYKSSPVDTESYLLECSRYIELNPLRAGIVGRPEQYRWSSFVAKAGLWDRPPPRSGCLLSGDGRDRAAKAKSLCGVCVTRCSTIRADAHSRGLATRAAHWKRAVC